MGNETMTPPEVLALGRDSGLPDTPGWRIRVVPNKYPAVELQGEPGAGEGAEGGIFRAMTGYGVHEVLVETPEHNRHPGALEQQQMELVVESIYRRCLALSREPNLQYIQVYRNHGREAGASIEHPHSQLIALPFVPPLIKGELQHSRDYYEESGGCPYCHTLAEELAYGGRMVTENRFFSAYIPYVARLPFETWIIPNQHQSSFLELNGGQLPALASIMGTVLGRLAEVLRDPPYNLYLHGAPLRSPGLPYYHWHLVIVPRLATGAGFEMGSGVYINITVPEESARYLREKGEIAVGI